MPFVIALGKVAKKFLWYPVAHADYTTMVIDDDSSNFDEVKMGVKDVCGENVQRGIKNWRQEKLLGTIMGNKKASVNARVASASSAYGMMSYRFIEFNEGGSLTMVMCFFAAPVVSHLT